MKTLLVAVICVIMIRGTGEGALFADVSTEQGTFTIALHANAAPLTVAHFIDLATGAQSWRDPVTGAIRGGDGSDAFYSEFSFNFTVGSLALLGGLRPAMDLSGGQTWNGPGYTILDEWTNGTALARGAVAMTIFDGPHSGGAEIGLILSDAMASTGRQWTKFGTILSGDLAVVDAIAYAVTEGTGPVSASIVIRDEGLTQSEIELLNSSRQRLPDIEPMPLQSVLTAQGNPAISFEVLPNTQPVLSTTTNLLQHRWHILPGNWHFSTNMLPQTIAMSSIPGLSNEKGFVAGSQTHYPARTARQLPSVIQITMMHSEVEVVYDLDFTSGAGSMSVYQNDHFLYTEPLYQLTQSFSTAHSVLLSFLVGGFNDWDRDLYWLGFDDAGVLEGRFLYESWYLNSVRHAVDRGTFLIVDP